MPSPVHIEAMVYIRDLKLPALVTPPICVAGWLRAWRIAMIRRRCASQPRGELN